jgi:CRP-like cAMP-binding protein
MDMGADDYISKPFTDIELLNAIESRIKKTDLLAAYNAPVNVLNEMINEFEGKDALEKITLHQPQNQYSKKQAVYKEGNHPQKLFYVISGKIKVFIANEEGKSLTIGLYSAGDFLGYTALLEGGVYKESAEALDESVVAEIPLASFENLLHQNPDASKKIIQLLAKNIRQKERQLLDVAYNSLRKRVANALVILMNKYRQPDEEQFSINISREDLANIAGTATESLIRTLSDFKSEKLVSISGSKITVINEQDLKEMVN